MEESVSILHWYKAIKEELSALHSNKTWSVVPRPVQTNVIGSKWIFKNKLKDDGTLDRNKAQLVTQGYAQY